MLQEIDLFISISRTRVRAAVSVALRSAFLLLLLKFLVRSQQVWVLILPNTLLWILIMKYYVSHLLVIEMRALSIWWYVNKYYSTKMYTLANLPMFILASASRICCSTSSAEVNWNHVANSVKQFEIYTRIQAGTKITYPRIKNRFGCTRIVKVKKTKA